MSFITRDPPEQEIRLGRLRPRSLLARFLLILAPIFLLLAIPGIGFMVYNELRADREALAARMGNLTARTAMALTRHSATADIKLLGDLMAPLAADRSFLCAELYAEDPRRVITALPAGLGCKGVTEGEAISLPVGDDGECRLLVWFSNAELVAAEKLQLTIALSAIALAFLFALLASVVGFRLIVGRPLRLLLGSIRHSTETGERKPIGVDTGDELGTVIEAFDRMQARDAEREKALIDANARLTESEGALKQLNQELERRVQDRTRDLEAAKLRAEAASESKMRFVWSISHELRTPLHAIIGFAGLMKQQPYGPLGNARYGEFASDIEASGERLLEIINNVLDIAKIDVGGEALREDNVHGELLIESCLAVARPMCEAAGLAFAFKGPDRPLVLWVDPARMKQILLNLLKNAVKFTAEGGKVEFAFAHDPSGGVAFTIRDTGIGMKQEDIAVALSPFGQLDDALSRSNEGVGLGLPLARLLTELHGGTLEIESEPDKGTTVTVRLPAARVVQRETDAA